MATYTSVGTGNWLDDATWSGSGTPGSGDHVIVLAGHTVNVAAPGGEAGSLLVDGGRILLPSQTLAVGGDCEIRAGGSITRVSIGTLTIGGDCKMRGNSNLQPSACTIARRLIVLGGRIFGSMTLAVSGTAELLDCAVMGTNASGGNRILAYGSKDLGSNINVAFYLARNRRAVSMLSRRAFQTGMAL
jgi:hypothetical protein